MDRVAHLVRISGKIRRRIWASLPFSERFAEVLFRLASTSTDAFGAAIYSAFIQRGVTDMPPINGVPVEVWGARPLPASYGRDFGRKVFFSLMRLHHNPAIVEDLLSAFALRFMERAERYLNPSTSLKHAESYVLRGLYNDSTNLLRRKRWEVGESTLERDGKDFLVRSPVPVQEKAVAHLLNSSSMRSKLRRIHPAAEQYLRLSLEGYTDVEILGDATKAIPSMLDQPFNADGGALTATTWNRYKKQIFKALKSGYENAVAL